MSTSTQKNTITSSSAAPPTHGTASKKRVALNRPAASKNRRPRTTMLRGNFQLYNESGNLKLFSEPNGGQKGAVFFKNRQVMRPFPRVKDVKVSSATELPFTDEEVSEMVFSDHHEGALIRVYYADGSWQVSTQRKIDAFKSRWSGSESFGELWNKALEEQVKSNPAFAARVQASAEETNLLSSFFNTLDTNKQYLFVVAHNEANRLVCDAPEVPTVLHVGTFSDGFLKTMDNLSTCTIDLPTPQVHRFSTASELRDHVLNLDTRQLSGCLGKTRDNKWYKFQNEVYLQKETVRGNEPSLRFRYLQVRLDGATVDDLYRLFPKHAPVFDECEDHLYAIAKYIHKAYMDRFIRRQFVQLEREFFSIMRICHEWHKTDRQNNKVTLDKVIEVLNTRYDHVLNKMIRMYKVIVRNGENNQELERNH